jgi:chemotaxis protein methyltransferase CheR
VSLRATTGVDEYAVFCEGFRRLSGLDLAQYKRAQMERRIRTFVERRAHAGLSPYLAILRADTAELDAFLDRVTINVSELWRHPDQFRTLARHVLPELAQAGRIRAWSAGSSYGAEAYTLAAVCRDVVPGTPTTITGTDIDRRMVERARRGVFTREDARGVGAAELRRHFVPEGDGYRATEELRRMVRFETGDLLRLRPVRGAHDLVLCRNTAIYFSEEVRDELHARLATTLRPGGVLLVGATERVADPGSAGLEPIHPFTYRKA